MGSSARCVITTAALRFLLASPTAAIVITPREEATVALRLVDSVPIVIIREAGQRRDTPVQIVTMPMANIRLDWKQIKIAQLVITRGRILLLVVRLWEIRLALIVTTSRNGMTHRGAIAAIR